MPPSLGRAMPQTGRHPTYRTTPARNSGRHALCREMAGDWRWADAAIANRLSSAVRRDRLRLRQSEPAARRYLDRGPRRLADRTMGHLARLPGPPPTRQNVEEGQPSAMMPAALLDLNRQTPANRMSWRGYFWLRGDATTDSERPSNWRCKSTTRAVVGPNRGSATSVTCRALSQESRWSAALSGR